VTSATFEAVRDLGGLKPVVGFSTKVGEVFFTDVHKTLAQGYDVSAVAKNMEFTYNPAAWGGKGKSSKVNWNITANTVDAPVAARAEQVLGNHSAGGDGVTAYLRLGESAGRSTAIGYENWTDVATLDWDVSALTSWLKGGGASVGKPNPGSLSWSQELDGSFLYALTNIAGGKSVPKLVIEYVRNGDHGPVTFMQDVFSDVYFTSIALNDTTVTNSVVFKSITETTWDITEQGKRGEVRAKPPLPALEGLFGKPTVVNNVLTLATVPWVMAHGAEAYAAYGMGRSRGTMPIQIAGTVKHGGLFETAFGITLGALVNEIGGGTASGRPVRAVQVGGPLGAYHPPSQFDTPFDYEAFTAVDGLIGHGGLVVFDDSVDMAKQARFAMAFCAAESCGKCTPCRLGSTRGVETLDRVLSGENVDANIALIEDLCDTMKFGSLCALGGFTPYPVLSALTHFRDDFVVRSKA
jgi:type VI protein secretion system component Hcp